MIIVGVGVGFTRKPNAKRY